MSRASKPPVRDSLRFVGGFRNPPGEAEKVLVEALASKPNILQMTKAFRNPPGIAEQILAESKKRR